MTNLSSPTFGKSATRIDGPSKVTGAARYASDEPVANPAYAYLVTSTVAKGSIRAFMLDEARSIPGVLDILTFENVGNEAKAPPSGGDGVTTTMEDSRIWHDGQIIAIVIAETYEAARDAAHRVRVEYVTLAPSASFDSDGVTREPHKPLFPGQKDTRIGDVAAALEGAPVVVDAHYSTPTQHHNPIELYTTTCLWDGPKLIIYEPSQFMWGAKNGVAAQLGISPDDVRVVSRYVGGAFGGKANLTARTAWIAIAARRLRRPVKLVATRDQGFTIATYRAETRHHVKLGADRDGHLRAFYHHAQELSSRPSGYNVSGIEATARMYKCPNIDTGLEVVHADRNTPGFMRAPPEVPYMFALECAIDELASKLGIDPVELRRINEPEVDPADGKPFSSRSLIECYERGMEAFGWSKRDPAPGSMRDGDWLIGYGCATACYPSNIAPAAVRLTIQPDGKVKVDLAGHELGTGAYTTVALAASQALGMPLNDIEIRMGDSDLPPVTGAGGSNNAATTVNVMLKACEELRRRLAVAAVASPDSPFSGKTETELRFRDGALTDGRKSEPLNQVLSRITHGPLELKVDNVPDGMPPDSIANLYKGQMALSGGGLRKDVTAYSFGCHFVEVRVHRLTREVRSPRVISVFAAGTIVNPLTAHSQLIGGAIWGLSSALHESTEIDPATARYVNDNFADYRIPVNADVPEVQIVVLEERDDKVNPAGIKGIGELGNVGMNAAVANAVFHATGIRVRDLPITAEKLI
ncbi:MULTISPECIES: xanthine dehydrogenase family protein molybdopterin-binding subunit [Sinorhizobium]|uniref:xanthine dehydrogenase family protein molybdopterin-binding subunit n=1 Tax=Sinorhizobium TaxID=28105 RepID=UPI0003FF9F2E|nr:MULTISPECIES: xanthine dehydrogenase family protein molybdopterin-binding subunit [Sinorhizobium]WOS67079.1 xanthine dehydrogenase family protein molybdopterin-binding subunit [Sinorhizobium fredii GR64]